VELSDHVSAFAHGERLGQNVLRSELNRLANNVSVVCRGEHDDGKRTKFAPFFDSGQNGDAIHNGHLQIEQQEVWKREEGTVGEGFVRVQIINGLYSVDDADQFMRETGGLELATQENEIVIIVFGSEDDRRSIHECTLGK